jgi:hypothetical protein
VIPGKGKTNEVSPMIATLLPEENNQVSIRKGELRLDVFLT